MRSSGAGTTVTTVQDDGVGVFRRVCEDFGYATPQDAIVQLEKGKLTSDPTRHSGEGLFFSSKAVTRFRLESQGVGVDRRQPGARQRHRAERRAARHAGPARDRPGPRAAARGPVRRLHRSREPALHAHAGHDQARRPRHDAGSRSEAKRLVARLTDFRHVTLDFSGVEVVGQGFCDEVFRVFARAHPEVTLEPVGMNDTVAFMVDRARAAAAP